MIGGHFAGLNIPSQDPAFITCGLLCKVVVVVNGVWMWEWMERAQIKVVVRRLLLQ